MWWVKDKLILPTWHAVHLLLLFQQLWFLIYSGDFEARRLLIQSSFKPETGMQLVRGYVKAFNLNKIAVDHQYIISVYLWGRIIIFLYRYTIKCIQEPKKSCTKAINAIFSGNMLIISRMHSQRNIGMAFWVTQQKRGRLAHSWALGS